ncbi:MAG: PQQ-binding-like beta-propeller repeat protein [Planctomycetaceae bacterium]|nr:PQQ-binding-like beta-propeller repeat protein [Planctomycetaceae bacterium]
MSALELIDLLAEKELISDRSIEKLRSQIQSSSKEITAQTLATLLVKKQLLTETLAKQLLKQLEQRHAELDLSEELELLPDEPEESEPELIEVDEPVASDDDLVPLPEDDDEPVTVGDSDDHAEVYDETLDEADAPDPPPIDDLLAGEEGDDEPVTVTVGKKKSGLAGMLGMSKGGPRRKFQGNRWDSPLILAGGGALLLLLFAAVGLWFYLTRGTGDDAFALAYDDYRQQSYGQAIGKFEKFLSDYPDHSKVSLAKVRIGLAKIWADVDRKRWDDAAQTSRTELAKIQNEDAFSEARPELATILPDIMDGFAEQALSADDVAGAKKYLELANAAFEDVNNAAFLPTSVRQGQQQRIEQIQEKLAAVKHRIDQDNELIQTISDIQAAANQGQIGQAYELRKTLLTKYPGLENDTRLIDAIGGVTEKERESVAVITDAPTVVTEDHQPLSQYQVTLASRRGGTAEGVTNRIVFAQVQGAVYGLKADTGDVLWRRYVGLDNGHTPLPVSPNVGADVLVVDSARSELLRLKADSGNLVWRLPCVGKLAAPVLVDGHLFVGFGDDTTGKLLELNPETGEVLGGANFDTGLATGPGYDAERNVIAQVGSHSSVYLMDAGNWNCQNVYYLGHAEGAIQVPPIVIQEQVVIAENPAPEFSLVHILTPDAETGSLKPLAKPFRFQGQIVVPIVPFGRRVLVATDRGEIHVLELDPANTTEPVREIAKVSSSVRPGTIGYPLLGNGRLWVGDSQLSKYELQTSRGQLVRKWINNKGDSFLAPLQRFADVLFIVRKRANRMGATVSAIRIDERGGGSRDGETIWDTDLGVPPAGEPFVNRKAQEIDVVTGNGDLFAINAAAIRAGIVDKPASEVLDNRISALHQSVRVGNNQVAFFGSPPSEQMVLFDPSKSSQTLDVVTLELQNERPAVLPTPFEEGLLVSTAAGPIYLLDVKTGKALVHPYLPPLQAEQKVDWLPAATTEDGLQAILADVEGRMYQLSVKVGQKSQVTATAQAKVEKKMVGRLAVLADAVFAATRAARADAVASFKTADLTPVQEWKLTGRVTWGPARLGDGVLVASDANELIKLTGDPEPAWRTDLPFGPLAGEPLVIDGDFVFAAVSGQIWRVDGQTGKEIVRLDVGEPLGTGPVQFSGNRLLVCGGDGTVHIVTLPSDQPSK